MTAFGAMLPTNPIPFSPALAFCLSARLSSQLCIVADFIQGPKQWESKDEFSNLLQLPEWQQQKEKTKQSKKRGR